MTDPMPAMAEGFLPAPIAWARNLARARPRGTAAFRLPGPVMVTLARPARARSPALGLAALPWGVGWGLGVVWGADGPPGTAGPAGAHGRDAAAPTPTPRTPAPIAVADAARTPASLAPSIALPGASPTRLPGPDAAAPAAPAAGGDPDPSAPAFTGPPAAGAQPEDQRPQRSALPSAPALPPAASASRLTPAGRAEAMSATPPPVWSAPEARRAASPPPSPPTQQPGWIRGPRAAVRDVEALGEGRHAAASVATDAPAGAGVSALAWTAPTRPPAPGTPPAARGLSPAADAPAYAQTSTLARPAADAGQPARLPEPSPTRLPGVQAALPVRDAPPATVVRLVEATEALRGLVERELGEVNERVTRLARRIAAPTAPPAQPDDGAARHLLGRVRAIMEEERFRSGKLR